MKYALNSESIQAYRTRVFVLSEELRQEKDPSVRAMTALYLAEAATTLARLETLEAKKIVNEVGVNRTEVSKE